jgi:hypothetical protein
MIREGEVSLALLFEEGAKGQEPRNVCSLQELEKERTQIFPLGFHKGIQCF